MPESGAADARRKKSQNDANEASDDVVLTASSETEAEFPMAVGLKAGTDAARRMMEAGSDMARAHMAQMSKQMGFMAEFATCRSPTEFADVYGRAVTEASQDFAAQLERLSKINPTDYGNAAPEE
ncbi:MAG: hypothetical protein JJ970_15035 [Erythrobacter sp.]|uniref:hypothetical protein n=1 Tax=Erythrobacter sp. TaxID=1042 RepID=UPI001AFF3785|nr:hypothetical protein [Erythrobacter sp.]MBO6531344.1 hypothetical protein [Erythrobacter sp.]